MTCYTLSEINMKSQNASPKMEKEDLLQTTCFPTKGEKNLYKPHKGSPKKMDKEDPLQTKSEPNSGCPDPHAQLIHVRPGHR